ncbi:MAG: helix-hairpin-helix domain-containing protein [Gemmatimonadota bacterium]
MLRRWSSAFAGLALVALASVAGQAQDKPAMLDLNTASRDQLLEFKGIGRAYADKIVQGRPFKMRSELVSRGIMPAAAYLKIKRNLRPTAEDASVAPAPAPEPTADDEGKLDLNHATRDQLVAIKGVGAAYADKIIEGRPYKQRSELVSRNIVPPSLYLKIKTQLTAKP